jgi:RNA polymerase sigma-70 factor (ECF subfamily)
VETDEQIIEAVKDGKREGQRLMVSRYGQMVFAMIVRQVTTTMDAEELTQDTFLRAFNNIDRYDSRRSSLGTWLCRIAYHLTLDFLKRRQPNIISMDDTTDISDEQLDTELSSGNEKRIQQLEMLMEELPPDEQMLLTLYYYEDRTLDECSFIMDTTSHALANRLYRIRKKLYKQLKKQNENS